MTGVGLPLAGSWTQMLPSPGAKINFPATGGAGGGVPSNSDVRTGGRSKVAEGRINSLVRDALGEFELHAVRKRNEITKSEIARIIKGIVLCGERKYSTGTFSGWQSEHFAYNDSSES